MDERNQQQAGPEQQLIGPLLARLDDVTRMVLRVRQLEKQVEDLMEMERRINRLELRQNVIWAALAVMATAVLTRLPTLVWMLFEHGGK